MLTEKGKQLITSLTVLAVDIHCYAKDKGFWDKERNFGEMIALMHSELSEALEAHRKDPTKVDEHCPEFTNIEIELADCIIRILDLCGHEHYRIAEAILAKMDYNSMRPYKHGKSY